MDKQFGLLVERLHKWRTTNEKIDRKLDRAIELLGGNVNENLKTQGCKYKKEVKTLIKSESGDKNI